MIKKIFLFALIFSLLPHFVLAKDTDLTQTLKGRILLQVESYGRAWYIDPVSLQRYYIRNGQVAYDLMKSMGLGITDGDLARIPTKAGQKSDAKLVNRLKGRILLQVQQHGEAWYINPVNGLRYYLANGDVAYKLMHDFALGISNDNLAKIPMNNVQVVQDTCFDDVAYVVFDGINFINSYNADQILPLASLTKLMTALVLLDTKPDWYKKITISQVAIDYPKFYVGNDATSEVDLAVGDTMAFYDLWLAMLISSSNQATASLVESTGMTVEQFVGLMNQKAVGLGLEKTIFYDVAGLDAANVTTPKEMAKIAWQAFNQPDVATISETTHYLISAIDALGNQKAIKVLDRNYSLQKFQPQASKTGYLVEARSNVALKKNGIIYVVLHVNHLAERNAVLEKLLN